MRRRRADDLATRLPRERATAGFARLADMNQARDAVESASKDLIRF
jgi:hypothetical protein